MAEAVILKSGRIIRITNLKPESLEFFNSGYLKSFGYGGKTYHAAMGKQSGLHAGYWDLDVVYRYYSKVGVSKEEYKSARFAESNFIEAIPQKLDANGGIEVEGDIIVYERRKLNLGFSGSICFGTFRAPYTLENVISFFGETPIAIADSIVDEPLDCNRIPSDSVAYRFYTDFFGIPESRVSLELRANIAQYIHNIDKYIYQEFLGGYSEPSVWEIITITALFKNYSDKFTNYDEFIEKVNKNILENLLNELKDFYASFRIKIIQIREGTVLEKRVSLAMGMPFNVLIPVDVETKIDMLDHLLINDFLSTTFEREEAEQLVIKIIRSFNDPNSADIDIFLDKLVTRIYQEGGREITMFEWLYESMSTDWKITELGINLSNWAFDTNWEVDNTKGAFCKYLYQLWIVSKNNPYDFSNGSFKEDSMGMIRRDTNNQIVYELEGPENVNAQGEILTSPKPPNPPKQFYYTRYVAYDPDMVYNPQANNVEQAYMDVENSSKADAAPIRICYESKKEFGFYNDNHSFNFKAEKIQARQHKDIKVSNGSQFSDAPVLYGSYDIYQPVSLFDVNQETKIPIQTVDGESVNVGASNVNSLVPIFMLKYIDDAGDRDDIQTALGYIFEIVLTVSVIGNAAKLYHLRHLSKMSYVSAVIGIIDASVTSLSFLLNFVDEQECNNSEFCKNLKGLLFWIEMATLSADGIASAVAYRQAKRVTKAAGVLESDDLDTATGKVKEALGSTDQAQEPAFLILQFANKASSAEIIANYATKIRELTQDLFRRSNELSNPKKILGWDSFIVNHYTFEDIKDIVEHMQQYVVVLGNTFVAKTSDFVRVGSKKGKIIALNELKIQISFYYLEVLKRGFPSGFVDLIQYKKLCNEARDFLSERIKSSYFDKDFYNAIDDFDILERFDNFDWKNDVKYVVQGSANRKYKSTDPVDPNTPIPQTGEPGDFEFAIKMQSSDFDSFMYILTVKAKAERNIGLINDIQKYTKKGFVKYDELVEVLDKNILNDLRSSISDNSTTFSKEDIDFAIVKEGSTYDLGPELPFTF